MDRFGTLPYKKSFLETIKIKFNLHGPLSDTSIKKKLFATIKKNSSQL